MVYPSIIGWIFFRKYRDRGMYFGVETEVYFWWEVTAVEGNSGGILAWKTLKLCPRNRDFQHFEGHRGDIHNAIKLFAGKYCVNDKEKAHFWSWQYMTINLLGKAVRISCLFTNGVRITRLKFVDKSPIAELQYFYIFTMFLLALTLTRHQLSRKEITLEPPHQLYRKISQNRLYKFLSCDTLISIV